MTIARTLAAVALTTVCACGTNGTNGTPGPTGLTGPEGPAGPGGANGQNGMNGTNGTVITDIALPGSFFFPESLQVTSDGTFYIGSLGTGQVYKLAPAAQSPTVFIGTAAGMKNVLGVLADEANGLLYVCDDDVMGGTAKLRSFKLTDGSQSAALDFPAGSICNDMAFDANGNLYATDSAGKIFKLAKGGTALNQWAMDALLAPATGQAFGVDGIVFDGTSTLYVNNVTQNKLARVPINADGTAGTVEEITVTPAISGPDGMRLLNATTVLVVENMPTGGKLTQVAIDTTAKTGTGTVLDNRLQGPTSVVKFNKNYWITEGQVSELKVGGNPSLPFYVRHIPTFE